MKKISMAISLFLFFGLLVSSIQAEDDIEIKKHPGYVNFDAIEIPGEAKETVEIFVRGPLLKLLARTSEREDPTLADVLSKLLLIKINTFTIDSQTATELKPKISKIESDLQNQNWEKCVRVRKQGELVNVYLKFDQKRIVGLVVMAIDEDNEAVFVNIVGETDWQSIHKIGRKFDIDELKDLSDEDKPR